MFKSINNMLINGNANMELRMKWSLAEANVRMKNE